MKWRKRIPEFRDVKYCSEQGEGTAQKGISDECKDFVRKLLVFDPNKRLGSERSKGIRELKEHPWLKDPPKGFSRDGDMAEALMEDLGEDMIPLARQKAARH